jgi:hypothetical protein
MPSIFVVIINIIPVIFVVLITIFKAAAACLPACQGGERPGVCMRTYVPPAFLPART